MSTPNYEDAVAITREIHWVGFYDQQAHLHCNPYRLMDDEGSVLFDPGSIPHLPSKPYRKLDLAQRIRLVLDAETTGEAH
jgi:hypothetical protein